MHYDYEYWPKRAKTKTWSELGPGGLGLTEGQLAGATNGRPERKLAHITVCGNSVSEIEQQMRAAQLSTPELRTLASKSAVRVAIIMGSDSDLPTMKDAAQLLEDMGVE